MAAEGSPAGQALGPVLPLSPRPRARQPGPPPLWGSVKTRARCASAWTLGCWTPTGVAALAMWHHQGAPWGPRAGSPQGLTLRWETPHSSSDPVGCPGPQVTADCPFHVDAPVLEQMLPAHPWALSIGPPFTEGLTAEGIHLKFLPAEAGKAFPVPTPCPLAAGLTGVPRALMGTSAGVHPVGRDSSPAGVLAG